MSLSLSSILNPSPDAETPTQSSPPPPQPSLSTRTDTLPPIQYVQSPDQQFTASPQSAHPPPHQYSYPPNTEQDAVQALASLSGSSAPPPLQSPWYPAPDTAESSYDPLRRSNSYERRPGSSGYGDPIQLPPPPPTTRQNSSPTQTLDNYHYHVPRSPDQHRPPMISPAEPTFTLPPIQSISPSQQVDHTRRPPSSHSQTSIYDQPQLPFSHGHPPIQDSSAYTQAEAQKEQPLSLDGAYDTKQSPASAQPQVKTSNAFAESNKMDSSPETIKQEALGTPRASSPGEKQALSASKPDPETQGLKPFMKTEQAQSPLRDSSVPVPSTEASAPEPTASKKRPAPAKTKKGTATATKKAPPTKKRKVETSKSKPTDRSTPLKALSSKGATPATSSPAASTRSVSAEPDDDVYEDDDDMDSGDAGSSDDVYCLCRKPDTGTFMIGCDGTCDDWFHGKCVGIEERDKNLIDKYVCPNCTKAGAGRTTWKRMCRRSGCRQPARVGKAGKGGKEGGGSKYCSEECGVMYFREMVAKTRGKEELGKNRHSRRKNSIASPEQTRHDPDDDLGPRGGALAAGELKALVNTSKTADEFKKLGEGVVTPPATPDSKGSPTATKDSKNDMTESEAQALENIHKQKDEARRKHQLLKDRIKFVTMVKQAASRTATEKELKPKEYCGYDSRIEWTEPQFSAWRNSKAGRQAFDLETLAASEKNGVDEAGDTDMEDGADGADGMADFEVCDRKKCARHLEWGKLAVDDIRFEMSDNSDRMRVLEREEKEVRERAALRSKAGRFEGLGSVEVHGLGISVGGGGDAIDAMEVA